jgi:uncharacterized protein YodC (DUF2158 family)
MENSTSTSSGEAEIKKQFPKGARVQLNAGGPIMAVKGYAEDDFFSDGPGVVCQWFSGRKLESGSFAPETPILMKDDAQEEQPS